MTEAKSHDDDARVERVARLLDPPAWSGREKNSDAWRRTHTLKKARAIIAEITAESTPEDEVCPACEGHTMGPGEFCMAGCRGGKVLPTTASVLRNIMPHYRGLLAQCLTAEARVLKLEAAAAESTPLSAPEAGR